MYSEYDDLLLSLKHDQTAPQVALIDFMANGSAELPAKRMNSRRSSNTCSVSFSGYYVPSSLDPYLSYLEQRVQEGCTNAERLWREIREYGYPNSSSQVTKWMQNRRKKSQPIQVQSLPAIPMSLPDLRTSVRRLTASPARLSSEEFVLLDMLLRVDPLRRLYELVQGFAAMVRHRQVTTPCLGSLYCFRCSYYVQGWIQSHSKEANTTKFEGRATAVNIRLRHFTHQLHGK